MSVVSNPEPCNSIFGDLDMTLSKPIVDRVHLEWI